MLGRSQRFCYPVMCNHISSKKGTEKDGLAKDGFKSITINKKKSAHNNHNILRRRHKLSQMTKAINQVKYSQINKVILLDFGLSLNM